METSIPELMKAVFIKEDGTTLKCLQVPVPVPGPGEVLVKMAAAPINPSDLARIRNITSPVDRQSFVPGIEGSGTVVAHGKGLLPQIWNGKRVACSASNLTSGTWAEYMVTSAMDCVPLPDEISDEQGSMMLVNPLTAVAFFDIIKQGKHKAVINTAAAGSLGRIIELLGEKHHIPVIHVVRNEKQMQLLAGLGYSNLLNSTSENFGAELHILSHRLNATLVLDAVGGSLTRQMLLAIPFGGRVLVYGNLSGEQPETDHKSLVMDNKQVSGFFLGNWLKEQGILTTLRSIWSARQLLKREFSVIIQHRFSLDQAQQAVETYLGNMTAGKILFTTHATDLAQ